MTTVEVSHLLTAILLSLVFALDLFPFVSAAKVCMLQMLGTSGADVLVPQTPWRISEDQGYLIVYNVRSKRSLISCGFNCLQHLKLGAYYAARD